MPRLIHSILFITLSLTIQAADYFVSNRHGNDKNDGRSPQSPWRSLNKLNTSTFQPGDTIHLESDTTYRGTLTLKDSGSKKHPITLTNYGKGAKPHINALGNSPAAVHIKNAQGWIIKNLHLSNTGKTKRWLRYGIFIENTSLPTATFFHLNNLTISEVNGRPEKDKNAAAAIRFLADGKSKTRFDSILIEHCHVINCSRNGIIVHGGALRGPHWNPSTNIIIRHNLIEGVGGDGILTTSSKGPLVEWNVMRKCPPLGEAGAAAAGMWPWACDDAVFQFNEVSGHQAWNDAQAYDCDYSCKNTLFQYNLSYNNHGGFMLICSPGQPKHASWLTENALNHGSVVRYNLSINDGLRTIGHKNYFSPTFSLSGDSTHNTQIYKNLIIIPQKPHPQIDSNLIAFNKWGRGTAQNTTFQNNVFVVLNKQQATFHFDPSIKNLTLSNNIFYGDVDPIKNSKEITQSNNTFSAHIPKKVSLSGPKEELKLLHDFLKQKGNPQEKEGIKIDWNPTQNPSPNK
ncbi:right-handed parallel beta-helix repeat-containing protein [Rubritalea tangerina]|uniref:Right-handed parallel beta-helix repeat-containing protein n=1 Tax=Rubritalea tangerina TaxID=430798 RepID=A0ABW4ZF49_9BACT